MTPWEHYERMPQLKFQTPAPADAPEVKGYRCYFQPTVLEWSVRADTVRVKALGPATRTAAFPGEKWWTLLDRRLPDTENAPPWITPPTVLLHIASQHVAALAVRVDDTWTFSIDKGN